MTNVAQVLSEKMHQAIYTIRPESILRFQRPSP